jgi:hypothetical protein
LRLTSQGVSLARRQADIPWHAAHKISLVPCDADVSRDTLRATSHAMQCDVASGGGTLADALGRVVVLPAYVPYYNDCICAMASAQTDIALHIATLKRVLVEGTAPHRPLRIERLSRTDSLVAHFAEVEPGVVERDRREYARLVVAMKAYMYENERVMASLEDQFRAATSDSTVVGCMLIADPARTMVKTCLSSIKAPLVCTPVTPFPPRETIDIDVDLVAAGSCDGGAKELAAKRHREGAVKWQEKQGNWSHESMARSMFGSGQRAEKVVSGSYPVSTMRSRQERREREEIVAALQRRPRAALPTLRKVLLQDREKRMRVRARKLAALPHQPCSTCAGEWWKRRQGKKNRRPTMDQSTFETWKRKATCIQYVHMDDEPSVNVEKRRFIDMHAGAGSDFECTPTQSPKR